MCGNYHVGGCSRIIAGLVSHHSDAIVQMGIDAHFTPVSCTPTKMVARAHLFTASKVPSQPYSLRHLVPFRREFLTAIVALGHEHLGNGGRFEKVTPVEGSATQVRLHKVTQISNRP